MADQKVTTISRIVDGTTLTQALGVDSSGRITIASIATSVIPGTSATHLGKAEDAAHSSGDTGVMALAVRQDTAAQLAGTDADYTPLITDANGRLHVIVGGSVTPGTAAANLGKAEDAAHTSGDVGVMALSVRQDSATQLAGTDADYAPLITDANGRLHVIAVTSSLTPGTAATNLGKAEDAGHTTGDVGVMALAVRNDANATLSGTDLDYTPLAVDAQGNLQVDVLSGGGSSSPTNATWDITNVTTPVNLAAGGTGNADSGSLDSKYLWAVYISSSVAYKAILGTNDNNVIVNKICVFGEPGVLTQIRVPPGFIQAPAAAAGTQGFRVALTNLDTSETADFYVSYAAADNIG